MPPNPYQRVLIHGIPVWKDSEGRLYYYETSTPPTPDTRIQIGTEATGFNPDWKTLLEGPLHNYREAARQRPRAQK